MPRNARTDVGGEIYHVINRANGRMGIFNEPDDYELFESLLLETKELIGMRILAYAIMPNHWHLILHPHKDGDLGMFMHRLSNAHTRKVHAKTKTNGTGHLYQGRYKSFIVDTDSYFLTLLKYVERNPVRAKLAKQCEDWQWGSAWVRINGSKEEKKLIDPPVMEIPHGYKKWVNTPDKDDDLVEIRTSVNKGKPFGKGKWVDEMVTKYHLESTQKNPGRPKQK